MKKLLNIVLVFLAVSLFTVSCLGSVEDDVVQECLKSYEMAKQSGDKTQIAVEAGLVAEAYKQAGDQANYEKWLQIAKEADAAMESEIMEEYNEELDLGDY